MLLIIVIITVIERGGTLNSYVFDIAALDEIFKKAVAAVEKGKEDLDEIASAAQQEYRRVSELLSTIRVELEKTIVEVDELEHLFQKTRIKLMHMTKARSKYTEEEVEKVYDEAQDYQVRLSALRARERELKKSRNDLERTERRLKDMVDKAQKMTSQMTVAAELLRGNFEEASRVFLDMHQRYQYGVKVLVAQEEERKRVAREIHDGPVQSLANVAMRADYCQRLHETKADSKAEVADELNEIKKLVQDCLIEMRQIIFNLRPMSLDDLGLIPALQRFTSTVQKNTSALINVTVLGKEVRLSGPIEIALFRLAQESINNAIKHSSCSQIDVKVEFADQEIVLVVKDDGLGFDVEEKKSLSSENHHFGLVGMEERIRLLGGKFGIESVLGEGTRVWCRVAYDTPGG